MALRGRLGRRHLTLQKQVDMIQGHGTSVSVEPCVNCPCLSATQQFDPNCPLCQGTGRYYIASAAFTTTLLLVNESSARTFQEAGSWIAGTIRASVLPGVTLTERDKVRMIDIVDTFSDEILLKGLDETVRFAHGVTLDLVADREAVYRPGTDYVLTPPNRVTWVAGGTAPSFGAQYAVRYRAQPEFLVVGDAPRLRVEGRRVQSSEVVLQRLDKLGEGNV